MNDMHLHLLDTQTITKTQHSIWMPFSQNSLSRTTVNVILSEKKQNNATLNHSLTITESVARLSVCHNKIHINNRTT